MNTPKHIQPFNIYEQKANAKYYKLIPCPIITQMTVKESIIFFWKTHDILDIYKQDPIHLIVENLSSKYFGTIGP
jgi:hypothetical protein